MLKNFLLFISLIFIFSCTTSVNETLYSISGITMGTTYSIKFITEKPINNNNIKAKIDTLLEHLNMQMSTYIPTSELSEFNNYKDTTWFSVSEELAFVIENALQVSKISKGKFDITIGPLVNLWGFGPGNIPLLIPSEKEIEKARKNIGYNKLSVRFSPPALKKANPKIYCDLSAIAKGYAVDLVSELLYSEGIKNYLVEIGGEVRSSGKKSGKSWRVGISAPNQTHTVQEVVYLTNLAMATSGSYWNYFEENGKRYSHTIDPHTGKPITHKLVSVSVVDSACMMADALATAIDVMGPKEGLEFAKRYNLSVYLIVKEKNTYKTIYTPQFSSLMKE
jgi:thiamine biosynthesis lipoprotein